MLRKTLLGLVVAGGLVAPATLTPAAQADHGRFWVRGWFCRYKVLYRDCRCERWDSYGCYHSHHRACEVAERLRACGYLVRIVRD